MEKQFNCPQCGSDRTQKARVLYESGTSASKMTMAGLGVAGGGKVGVGVGAGAGTSQTELAKKLSPPVKPALVGRRFLAWLLVAVGSFTLFNGFLLLATTTLHHKSNGVGFLIFGGICAFSGIFIFKSAGRKLKKRKVKYEEDYTKWERTWYCNRCGHIIDELDSKTFEEFQKLGKNLKELEGLVSRIDNLNK